MISDKHIGLTQELSIRIPLITHDDVAANWL
jgi:hypothetical protein